MEENTSLASLSSTAVLYPESKIENMSGIENRIIIGENTHIRGHLLTYPNVGRIKIGNWCYMGNRSEFWSMNSITVGNRVLIAHDVKIHDGNDHSLDAQERHQHFRNIILSGHPKKNEDLPGIRSSPIVIDDDVWIGFNVTILKGVHIGKGTIVAANSIVTKDIGAGMFYRCEVKPIITPLDDGTQYE